MVEYSVSELCMYMHIHPDIRTTLVSILQMHILTTQYISLYAVYIHCCIHWSTYVTRLYTCSYADTHSPSTVPQVQNQVAKETNMRVLNIHCMEGYTDRQTDRQTDNQYSINLQCCLTVYNTDH